METFKAKQRSDHRAKPMIKEYRFMEFEECEKLHGHSLAVDQNGDIVEVRITSVQSLVRRKELRIGYKYGLYEYGKIKISPLQPNRFFVAEVEGG